MSTKKRVVSAVLAAAVGVSLLCGFGFAKKDYVYQQFETAEPVTSVTVGDASAKVTIRAADTDHITVRYAALPDEEPLYDISVQDGRLVVEVLDDVDVDTTDDDGPALLRIRMDGHSIDPTPDRAEGELTEEGDIEWNERYHRRMAVKYGNKACRACRIFPICHGGCSQTKLEAGDREDCLFGLDDERRLEIIRGRLDFILKTKRTSY